MGQRDGKGLQMGPALGISGIWHYLYLSDTLGLAQPGLAGSTYVPCATPAEMAATNREENGNNYGASKVAFNPCCPTAAIWTICRHPKT